MVNNYSVFASNNYLKKSLLLVMLIAKGYCVKCQAWMYNKAFIKVNLIIFHMVFLRGCYDFLDVWLLVIN